MLKKIIKSSALLMIIPRMWYALKYPFSSIPVIFKWSFSSRETSTFTFQLTQKNEKYLIHAVSLVTGKCYTEIAAFFDEIKNNTALANYVIGKIKSSKYRHKKDLRCDFGSRAAWYAIVRATKPKAVLENGVEMGYNAVLLSAALLKNKEEGYNGKYYGLDINSDAGYLIKESPYNSVSEMIINDTLDTLVNFKESIDFYFSDGLRTCNYEKKEFALLMKKINGKSIVVTNKLGLSDALADAATEYDKRFIYFQEKPLRHWYPGSELGIMF